MRSAAVVGTGLIGTSIALALSARGVIVYLIDQEPMAALTAAAVGAGRAEEPLEAVDLAILAVPPAKLATTLAQAQKSGLARAYTDVASVKTHLMADIVDMGCDLTSFAGGHPMAGGERSGPLAARANLFEGRAWILSPYPTTSKQARQAVESLIEMCGAYPLVMKPSEHDAAVALVSHAPHMIASLMAARLEHAAERQISLAGQGVRDVTRIAAGDPWLWLDILSANAGSVADTLTELARDLEGVIAALRHLESGAQEESDWGAKALLDVLNRGVAGRERLPNKHGAPKASYMTITVPVGDQPGELARLFADIGATGVNIEDVFIDHDPGKTTGVVELLVTPEAADALSRNLKDRGRIAIGLLESQPGLHV
ncbi:prephenate dehydrogenase [Streptomyces sp. WAC08241]|uniref:prephenate dehydrogenase n=1 Tax=Streptomyces sp. WAC08241 TaxID=2487421 RepID=UPI000F769783|nr:prephenate dehydrogenase [Streptomyces sp. WAC08241]RSS46782.1 prephenate dehydrogenase [Streptomyces sp. WAC08241]